MTARRFVRDQTVTFGFGIGWEQTRDKRWFYLRVGRNHLEWRWAR